MRKGLTNSSLKIIACITMFIDHIAAGILLRYMTLTGYNSFATVAEKSDWIRTYAFFYYSYHIMRYIGRLAFPIFGFLIIQGVLYTSSRWKYALRLFVFAVLSEVPYDLGLRGRLVDMSKQNVFFTLLLGMLAISLIEVVKKIKYIWLQYLLSLLVVAAAMYIAYVMKTDYGYHGVIMIVLMYVTREFGPAVQGIGASIVLIYKSLTQITAPLDIPLLMLYNGKRGSKRKIMFYIFYPAHLLFIYLIQVLLGLRTFLK